MFYGLFELDCLCCLVGVYLGKVEVICEFYRLVWQLGGDVVYFEQENKFELSGGKSEV